MPLATPPMRASVRRLGLFRRPAAAGPWPCSAAAAGACPPGRPGAQARRSYSARSLSYSARTFGRPDDRAGAWHGAARPGVRLFASSRGGSQKVEEFPDSWVEPDALWEATQDSDETRSEDEQFEAIFGERNHEWREKMLKENPGLFDQMGAGQSPKYLWIGCADSRVAAEVMVGALPGEMFVHRNIANMVVSTDTGLRSVLQYAVHYLKVEHIIVCGHYDCGGVRAACSKKDHTAPLESWLANIRDVVRLHHEELEAIIDDEERHKRLVELNVIEQCLNLFKTGDVQRRRAECAARPDLYTCAYPRIHGMVFDPSDGILRRLPVDFKEYMRKYKKVYQMYEAEDFLASISVDFP